MYNYKPIQFFTFSFIWTWLAGFLAAYLSYHEGLESFQLVLIFFGMCGPLIGALAIIYTSHDKVLIRDFWERLKFNKIKKRFLSIICILIPGVLFSATAISLGFNQPMKQFLMTHDYRVMEGQGYFSLFIIILASIIEELGWRGYGIDSLRSRFNLLRTTLIFAILWSLWHIPLFFINGYYQNILWKTNVIYVVNFFISIFPAALLINWIYYKNNRSIMAAFLLHLMLNLSAVLFQTEQVTKCIMTLLLLLISGIIIVADKKFFFQRKL